MIVLVLLTSLYNHAGCVVCCAASVLRNWLWSQLSAAVFAQVLWMVLQLPLPAALLLSTALFVPETFGLPLLLRHRGPLFAFCVLLYYSNSSNVQSLCSQ